MTPECGLLVGPMGVLGLMRLAGDRYREELWGPRRPGHGPAAAGSPLLCRALLCKQSSTAEREGGGRRRAEIAILLTGGPALWWWTNPQLRSVCIAAGWPGVPNYGNVVAQSELVIRRPVSHALAPLSAHIHWRGEGLLEMYGEGIDTCLEGAEKRAGATWDTRHTRPERALEGNAERALLPLSQLGGRLVLTF